MGRGPVFTDKEKETIRALKESGMPVRLIQERTGRSIASIYSALREKKNNEGRALPSA